MERADEQDFETFVRRSSASLLKTAWLLTGDLGHAEDVVQTALERTARRWSRLHGQPEAYARRVVVNASTDRFRRRRSRVAEVALVGEAQVEPAGGDGVDSLALRDALLSAVRQLPPRQRSVLVLRFFLDLDVRETAETLAVSSGTVTSSTARALTRLRVLVPDLDPSVGSARS